MVRECMNCNIEMKGASVNTGAAFVLMELKKGFGAKASTINAYVCPKCGHIELVAGNPEIFDK